ncbi:39S ribosomal protein L1, mitochondrial isoform X1 [Oncorhynchus keta]|uniref:39S ribosomal protein L1, mitochondrial isoform X1 n=1 Tax=Oncorhynchus keta TaxID=8018 RepID=UPI00227BE6D1|nr:39S ribosomal protein L1, mitochondrial isoform X1 [Oncorhynchus keta]
MLVGVMTQSMSDIVSTILAGGQRHLLVAGGPTYRSVSPVALRHLPVRTYAAAKIFKKDKKDEKEKEEKRERKPIDNTGRHKPYGLTAWAPVDDVYVTRFYPKPVYETAVAVDMLKGFQTLDYTTTDQPVYINLKLDMKLEKKKKVDPFVSTVHLPHPFKTEVNKVAVFTENPDQVKVAQENGAAFVGGADLVQKILDDEVDADFYVAVPDMISKLLPLKNKLRKKFPKNKRGSVGVDIPKMLELFKTGHEYAVEKDAVITRVGTLDMSKEQLIANMQTVVEDVCSHRPASFGHFVERAIVTSQSSEALLFKSEELVQKTPMNKDA